MLSDCTVYTGDGSEEDGVCHMYELLNDSNFSTLNGFAELNHQVYIKSFVYTVE